MVGHSAAVSSLSSIFYPYSVSFLHISLWLYHVNPFLLGSHVVQYPKVANSNPSALGSMLPFPPGYLFSSPHLRVRTLETQSPLAVAPKKKCNQYPVFNLSFPLLLAYYGSAFPCWSTIPLSH